MHTESMNKYTLKTKKPKAVTARTKVILFIATFSILYHFTTTPKYRITHTKITTINDW